MLGTYRVQRVRGLLLLIDAHAHLVAPTALYAHRSLLMATSGHGVPPLKISDALLAESAASNIAVMDGVGTDVQLLSPRPYQQGHSMRPASLVDEWMGVNNDLIARTVEMHPTRFAGVCGLPFIAEEGISRVLPELERTVESLGFVGLQLNPDPTEGQGSVPALGDRYWYPLYEKMCELDVPALVHSAGCQNDRETYSEHFITEESIAILSILRSTVFDDFPSLKLIIGHGGGSVPYQVGRWRAARLNTIIGGHPDGPHFDGLLRKFWFDTVLYNQESLELLFRVVGADRCLFGTEKPGSGSAVDPSTGRDFDDLRPVIEEIDFLSDGERDAIFSGNAQHVFPRLKIATEA
jgi:predicted TIM-barrel fold metal-dependent hydrolase